MIQLCTITIFLHRSKNDMNDSGLSCTDIGLLVSTVYRSFLYSYIGHRKGRFFPSSIQLTQNNRRLTISHTTQYGKLSSEGHVVSHRSFFGNVLRKYGEPCDWLIRRGSSSQHCCPATLPPCRPPPRRDIHVGLSITFANKYPVAMTTMTLL